MRETGGARDLLLNIDGGIYREVSISWRYRGGKCSICGEEIRTCSHSPGQKYDHKRCYFWIENVLEVLEGSLVYRGADKNAELSGVHKRSEGDLQKEIGKKVPPICWKDPGMEEHLRSVLGNLSRGIRRAAIVGSNPVLVALLTDLGVSVSKFEEKEGNGERWIGVRKGLKKEGELFDLIWKIGEESNFEWVMEHLKEGGVLCMSESFLGEAGEEKVIDLGKSRLKLEKKEIISPPPVGYATYWGTQEDE